MSELPAKVEAFTPAKAPADLVLAVSRMGGGDIVDSVLELVYLDYDFPVFSRQDARDLISFVRREAELDEMVLAPTDSDFLDAKINRSLARDLDRILEENELLEQIASQKDGKIFVIEESGEQITPKAARNRLNENVQTVLTIKKSLSETKKVQADIDGGGAGLNISFNLGAVVSDSISRIKEAELIDAEAKSLE